MYKDTGYFLPEKYYCKLFHNFSAAATVSSYPHTYIVPICRRIKLLLLLGQPLILVENPGIILIVYRIIRLFSRLEIIGIFISDYGGGLFAELKMLVFDNTGVRSFTIGIVYDSIALKVFYICQALVLKS